MSGPAWAEGLRCITLQVYRQH